MDLIAWAIVVVAGVVTLVVVAFLTCAVSDLALRLAAWLYSPDRAVQADRLQEWRGEIEAMKPSERPSHAGSLLWLGARHAPRALAARITRLRLRRATIGAREVAGVDIVFGEPEPKEAEQSPHSGFTIIE